MVNLKIYGNRSIIINELLNIIINVILILFRDYFTRIQVHHHNSLIHLYVLLIIPDPQNVFYIRRYQIYGIWLLVSIMSVFNIHTHINSIKGRNFISILNNYIIILLIIPIIHLILIKIHLLRLILHLRHIPLVLVLTVAIISRHSLIGNLLLPETFNPHWLQVSPPNLVSKNHKLLSILSFLNGD